MSSEEERNKKLKNHSKTKPTLVSQIGQEPESLEVIVGKVPTPKKDSNSPNSTITELQELKAEIEALRNEVSLLVC